MSDQQNPSQAEPQIKVLPKKRIVRKLAVGQEVQGRVKRLTDFGAFIDIGVGTDALMHVSEMSQRRIKSPKDVLKVGQEVTAWIKKLDKAHNRISLTMLPPGTRTIRDLEVGEVLTGTVTRITNYGAFVDIGVGYDGMVHVKEMAYGYVKHPSDMVQEGQEVQVEVIKVNRRRGQIDLSMKNLLPEPEPEAPEEPMEADEPEMDLEAEEEKVLSPFELALLKAQEKRNKRKEKKRKKKSWF
ncbi:MAG TPA: S1 RNA-binding domain-containing protein, partial [Caldilineae bacterium]|nr:S1 RNA-binding domain-containing protein [Caldilineae bacterium]